MMITKIFRQNVALNAYHVVFLLIIAILVSLQKTEVKKLLPVLVIPVITIKIPLLFIAVNVVPPVKLVIILIPVLPVKMIFLEITMYLPVPVYVKKVIKKLKAN